jgi:hypothetical protein
VITKADADAPWMSPKARIIAAALAEVGVSVRQPPKGEQVSVKCSASVPIDVRYRALGLAHLGVGEPVMDPSRFLHHLARHSARRSAVRPTDAELAAMQRFYDLHGPK